MIAQIGAVNGEHWADAEILPAALRQQGFETKQHGTGADKRGLKPPNGIRFMSSCRP